MIVPAGCQVRLSTTGSPGALEAHFGRPTSELTLVFVTTLECSDLEPIHVYEK